MDAPPLDLAAGLAACAGSKDLHQQVANLLASELDTRTGALLAALASGDLATTARMAHKHKGACLAVGAKALAETFAATDLAARAGDLAATTARAEVLAGQIAAFKAAVTALG